MNGWNLNKNSNNFSGVQFYLSTGKNRVVKRNNFLFAELILKSG